MRRPLRRGIGGRADAFARDFSGFLQAVRHRRYSSTRFALPLVSAASRKERRKKRHTPCPVGLASRGRRLLLGCLALFPGPEIGDKAQNGQRGRAKALDAERQRTPARLPPVRKRLIRQSTRLVTRPPCPAGAVHTLP